MCRPLALILTYTYKVMAVTTFVSDTYIECPRGNVLKNVQLSSDGNRILGGRYSVILSAEPCCDLFFISVIDMNLSAVSPLLGQALLHSQTVL